MPVFEQYRWLRGLLVILAALCLCGQATAKHASAQFLNKQSQYVCDSLTAGQVVDYSAHFSAQFRQAVPAGALNSILAKLKKRYGVCSGWLYGQKRGDHAARILTQHKTARQLLFDLAVDPQSGVITGLMALGEHRPVPVFASIQAAAKAWVRAVQGAQPSTDSSRLASVLISTNNRAQLAIQPDARLAIGSAFKLWVLAALDEKIRAGEFSWDKKIQIQDALKSLPSGTMQTLAEGTPVSLRQLAENMIRISDNTATDHLIAFLGRRSIENYMARHGLSSFANTPFLSTRELFVVRAVFTDAQAQQWQAADRSGRLQMLKALPQWGPVALAMQLSYWKTPKHIQQIEWFASPRDICKTMQHLNKVASSQAKKILSLNTPLLPAKHQLSYAGFKGGSEPGVLTLNYLLKTADGNTHCIQLGANNSTKPLNEQALMRTAEGLLSVWLQQYSGETKASKAPESIRTP
jgi:hypothetical protein